MWVFLETREKKTTSATSALPLFSRAVATRRPQALPRGGHPEVRAIIATHTIDPQTPHPAPDPGADPDTDIDTTSLSPSSHLAWPAPALLQQQHLQSQPGSEDYRDYREGSTLTLNIVLYQRILGRAKCQEKNSSGRRRIEYSHVRRRNNQLHKLLISNTNLQLSNARCLQ